MTAEWAIRRFVEITCGPGGMCCEWVPDRPRRPLTKQEIRNYRAGRDSLLSEVASAWAAASCWWRSQRTSEIETGAARIRRGVCAPPDEIR
jgi:hypothetical protein